MTDRPIFTIDLDDSAFKDFAEIFTRFQEQAASMSGVWSASDDLIEAARKNLDLMTRELRAPEDVSIADDLERANGSWFNMARSARGFSSRVHDATLSLAKWSGLTSVFTGIVAAGGFWGISRLAEGASAKRSAAAQFGTTYGAMQSAETSFGRLGGVQSMLSGIASAISSVQGMGPLFSLMGGEAEKLRGGDPAEALAAILPKLKRLADTAQPGNLRERISAMGLDRLGVSVETLKMLRGMSEAEVAEMVTTYRENKKRLELSGQAQKSLQDFTRQLDLAGARMMVLIGENLSHLTPVVGKVATALAGVIEAMLKSGGPVEKALDRLDGRLQDFARWIDQPEFMRSVEKFMNDVEAAGRLFTAIGGIFGGGSSNGQTPRFQNRPTVQPDGSIKDEPYEIGPDGDATPARPGHGRMMLKERGAARSGFTPAVPAPGEGESVESVARRIQAVRPSLESAQCVALAKAMVGSRDSVRSWRRGENALSGNLVPGTPVATFMDRRGGASTRYDAGGTGAPGNHTTHAAVFEGYIRDSSGRIVGMKVHEQSKNSGGPHRGAYFSRGFGTSNAANYFSINDPSGRPLGGRRNPMSYHQQGAQNHVEVHDHSDGGSRVAVDQVRNGPMPNGAQPGVRR